jgi:hypothetical protein
VDGGRSGEGESEHDGGRDECDIKGGMRQGTVKEDWQRKTDDEMRSKEQLNRPHTFQSDPGRPIRDRSRGS